MIYRGACHCGAVSAEYETRAPVRLRQDGCSFCTSRGVKSASDPDGTLRIKSAARLTRYRFGHKTADFLICSACGTYVAAMTEGASGPVAVINVVGLNISELRELPAAYSNLDGEDMETRQARRRARWTPLILAEGQDERS
jgi:hypothetical protein